ncbi:10201_t:CDS:2 [Entrophospora sp. SA101]|nr:10201_t:CDS:2 [Entrophospora sp. SA101]
MISKKLYDLFGNSDNLFPCSGLSASVAGLIKDQSIGTMDISKFITKNLPNKNNKNQRNAGSNMDNLWLDVGKILQEKMINTGTNIRLVSCDGIQINNVMNNSPSLNQNVDEHQGIDEFSEIWYLPYSLHFFSTHLRFIS